MASLVQSAYGHYNTNSNAQTSLTATFSGAQTAGNCIVVFVSFFNNSAASASISDSANGAYPAAQTSVVSTDGSTSEFVFILPNIAHANAGANTLTLTINNSGGAYPEIYAEEWSGLATTSPVDATATARTTTNTGNGSIAITTTNANDVILTGLVNNANGWTAAGSGFTLADNPSGSVNIFDYDIVSSAGTYTDTPTAASGGNSIWTAIAVALKQTGGGGNQTVSLSGIASTISVPSPRVSLTDWSLGQAWPQTSQVSTASTTITGPAASVVGRALVLWIWYSSATATISSITDNAAGGTNTYTVQGTSTIGSSGLVTAIATTKIARVPASGPMTITVTLSGAPTLFCLAATEYNGLGSSTLVVDPVSILQDSNNGWIEELITSTYSDALYITGTYSNNNTTITAATGWTLRGNNSTGQAAADSLGGGLGNVVGPPLNVTNTAPNTSAVSFAILASDSVLVGKNAPVATPSGSPPDQYARGVFGLSTVDDSSPSSLPYWTQNNLMGFAARFSWAALEPTEGTFNWAPIDAVLSLAQSNNKYVSIGILTNPGPSSGVTKQPSWLGSSTQGACSTYTYWNAANTASTAGYAPWDPIFQYYLQRLIAAFGARYDGNPYICYVAMDSGVGDGEANITKGTNGLAQLTALGGTQIWVNAVQNGYWFSYFSAFRHTQLIFVTGAPTPGDVTTMPSMLSYGTGLYGSQFGFKSDGLVANTAPSDFFNSYVTNHPIAFQFSQTGSVPDSQFAAVMANGFTLGGDVTKLGGLAFEIYKPQATGSANIQNVLSLYNSLLFYNGSNPIVPQPFPVIAFLPGISSTISVPNPTVSNGSGGSGTTWVSNGAQTGGSGAYVAGTQSVGYILANFAHDGDTITVPAGTFDWGNATTPVTTLINKAITLQGVNPGSPGNTAAESAFTTIIRNNNATGDMITATAPTTGHIVFEYICFQQIANNSGGAGFALTLDRSDVSGGALVTTPYTCLVHDCYFDGGTIYSYQLNVLCNGVVVWQCTFNTSTGANGLGGITVVPAKYGGLLDWNCPDTMGSGSTAFGVGDTSSGYAGVAGLNNSYFETCFIIGPSGFNLDSNARAVIRHCVIQDTQVHLHGGTSQYPVRHVECYSNNITNVNAATLNTQCWVTQRSGLLLFTGNTVAAPPVGKAPVVLFLENLNRANYAGAGQTVYPASRQIGYGWSAAKAAATTSQTGTLNGTTTVTGLNTATIYEGQKVSGTNIASGCLVEAILSPTSIQLSIAATGSGSSSLTFTGTPFGFPPILGANLFGSGTNAPTFDYGQQLNPSYYGGNSGAGAPTTAAQYYIDQYSTDGFGNNLTVAGNIYFNQQASAFSSAAVGSLPATFPGTQSGSVAYPGSWKNDLLLCMVSWTTSGTPTVTVTDASSPGNTWTQIGSTYNASTGESQALFAAINKSTTAAFAVTVHFSTNVSGVCMNIADYAGNWISVNQLQLITTDGSVQNSSTSSGSLSTGNITTTGNSGGNDLIIAWAKSGGVPTGVSSGWTQQAYDSTNHFGFYDNVGSAGSAGSFSTTGTFGLTATTTAPWTISAVAIQSMPFLLSGRDFYMNSTYPSWSAYTYPHPLTTGGNGQTVALGGIGSTLTLGQPTVVPGAVGMTFTGIPSSLSVGEPSVLSVNAIALAAIASTISVPSPSLVAANSISLVGIPSTVVVPNPTIILGGSIIALAGIASTLVVPSLAGVQRGTVSIVLPGIGSTISVPAIVVSEGGTTIFVNVGGTWQSVTSLFYNNGGVWVPITKAFVNVSGTWREVE